MTRERRAYICRDRDGSVHRRVFLLPGEPDKAPRCGQHGTMKRQPNLRYNAKAK